MDPANNAQTNERLQPSLQRAQRTGIRAMLLGLGLVALYASNTRNMGTYDTAPTKLMMLTIARGEGVYLDRFRLLMRTPKQSLPTFVRPWQGHILSRYPVAPAILVQPLVLPQFAVLDWLRPGWDRSPWIAEWVCEQIARRTMSILTALTAVMLYWLLVNLGLSRVALPATLAAVLGSDLWTVASQALWQHGPAAFSLTAILLLLHHPPVLPCALMLAGLATAFLFSCRLLDSLFAGVVILWVARTQPRDLLWFLVTPVVAVVLLLNYNFSHFQELTGGQAELEQLHRSLHQVAGPWSGNIVEGAMGTLLSPSRGLFIYTPWIALAVAVTPFFASRLAPHRLIVWLLLALIPYFLLLSKYAVWWGGHCFGPRYWTEVTPLFAILLAFGLDWALDRSRILTILFAITIALGIMIQLIGVYCAPSSWNLTPLDVDSHHERLWDWRDNELSRSLRDTWKAYENGTPRRNSDRFRVN